MCKIICEINSNYMYLSNKKIIKTLSLIHKEFILISIWHTHVDFNKSRLEIKE